MVVIDLSKAAETDFPVYAIPANARIPSDYNELASLPSRNSEVGSVFGSTVQESLRGPSIAGSDVPLAVYEFPSVDEDTQYDKNDLRASARSFQPVRGAYQPPKKESVVVDEVNGDANVPLAEKVKVKPPKVKWCIIDYPFAMIMIACIEILFAIGNIARAAIAMSDFEENRLKPLEIIQIVLMCIWLVLIAILFFGMYKRSAAFVVPHWVTSCIIIVALTIFFILYCVHGHTAEIVIFAVCVPILAYCLFIEFMYVKVLRYRAAVRVVMYE